MSTRRSKLNHLADRILRRFGLRRWIVRRPDPPPLLDDPGLAVQRLRDGQAAAIRAPITRCVIFNGLSLAPDGWHPLVAAARELLEGWAREFQGSCLEKYYDRWQPADALEALIGASLGPESLREFPRHLMHAPWLRQAPGERLKAITHIIELENAAFGDGSLGVDAGYGLQGPVSLEKGRIEYQRLATVVSSIRRCGYDRSRGDITAQVMKRGDEYRFRIVHGHHRAAALAALNHDFVALHPKMIIDIAESATWPQVAGGVWSQAQAEAFFHHHFDFDSLEWARHKGLA